MSAELLLALGVGILLGGFLGWALRGRKDAPRTEASADMGAELAGLESELASLKELRKADAADREAGKDAEVDALERLEEIIKSAENRLKFLEQSLQADDRPESRSE